MDSLFSSEYVFTRLIFQKALGFIYLLGFLIAAFQGKGLLGDHGILPAKIFLERTSFSENPSIFYFYYSETFFAVISWFGVALACFAILGFSESSGYFLSMLTWTLMWALYMSIINVGQVFYGFGWEILLLEAGFLAIFLGPHSQPVPLLIIWLYRWLAFRLMFGAGLIKIRGDDCWRDYTCMYYHYETQPLPNPLSWYFHHFPKWLHRFSIIINHYVELIAPFGLFGPQMVRYVAGASIILFQLTIFAGGNYSWLNCISIVVCIACFDDDFFRYFGNISVASFPAAPDWFGVAVGLVFLLILILSYQPLLNLFSPRQAMNRSFDRLNLVNTYGAFGSITRERMEIIIEGTMDKEITTHTVWLPYNFKGKPGDPVRLSPQVSPYHYKLDWQMWFAAMSDFRYNPWILNLVAKLLDGNKDVLGLLQDDPFNGKNPHFIRAELYHYKYTNPGEAGWWKRERVASYLPPLSLDNEAFKSILLEQGWSE